MKKRIIPIFVPHRGCPHDCIFCNQKKITGVSTEVTAQDARNIIEECLETIDKDTNVEIAFSEEALLQSKKNVKMNYYQLQKNM